MNFVTAFFDINNIFFTFMGYPMSYLEFAGTLLNLASVWLVSRNNILTWPVGNVGVILFGALFYQIQLYSDFIEQIYFLLTGFYGWWAWGQLSRRGNKDLSPNLSIRRSSRRVIYISVACIVIGTLIMGACTARLHIWMPGYFPKPASLPYLDAFTTVMSFVATILMARKFIESWWLWILVDLIGIGLYFYKGVVFISILYLIFLCLATYGLMKWTRIMNAREAVA